jgi:hypothetical protein
MASAAVVRRLLTLGVGLGIGPGCFYDWDGYQRTSPCTGEFGAPELVLYAPFTVSGIAVAQGGLELFVLRTEEERPVEFWRAARGSLDQLFVEASPVPELTALCASSPGPLGIDVSGDGLRAYVTCQGPNPLEPGAVLVTSRPSLAGLFEGAGATVGASFSAVRVGADELVMYATAHPLGGAPLQASRASVSGMFGDFSAIAGMDRVPLESPAPADDGRALFGTLTETTTQLGSVTRAEPGEPFGPFAAIYTRLDHAGVPAVQRDCRALYFVASGTGQGISAASREVHAMRR